jgi:signal transduction histidine kinase
METAASEIVRRLPWPLMVVKSTGEVVTNRRFRQLVGLTSDISERLDERFEIARFGGPVLTKEELPWRRAARGEIFEDEEIWCDRESSERRLLHVRSQPWGEETVVALENISDQSWSLRQAELIGSIGAALLRAEEPTGVAHAIVEDVARALGAEAVFLLAAEQRDQRLRLLSSFGLPPEFVEAHQSVSLGMPTILAVAGRTQTLQEVERIEALPERDFGSTRKLLELGLRSTVAVPLIGQGELIGVLALAWRHAGRLNKLERRTLHGVAAACALGLLHARSRVAERREAGRLRTLHEASLALESALPLRILLKRLVEQACELTGARYGALGLLDPNPAASGLADFVSFGVPDEVAAAIGHLPEGHGLLGAVIREGKTIRVPDLRKDPRFAGFPPHHPQMTSFLGVPLRIGRELFGNFYLCDKAGDAEFTEEDERMLELFAAQSALAVGYARQMQLAERAHKEMHRVRDQFAAVIAHDLRSPISTMLFQLEDYLGRAGQDESVSVPVAVLERMRRTGYRISQMTNDLLDVSRIELGRLSLDRRPVVLPRAVEALLAQMALNLGGHPVSVEIRGDVPPVLADLGRFDQILTNLVENAVKYSGPAAPIQIIVEATAAGAVVTVADRGLGIPADELTRLFDRFYQAPRAREKKSGLGLGLYIAKGLVEAQGGRIWVDSNVGQGSRFHIWLPAAEPRSADATGALA